MEQKLILFDVDNTLVDHSKNKSEIPKETFEALNMLKKSGHLTGIATGRSLTHVEDIMDMLGLENLVCFGGHVVIAGGKEIHRETIDREQATRLIKAQRRTLYPVIALDEANIYVKDFMGQVKKALYKESGMIHGESNIWHKTPYKKLDSHPRDYLSMMIFRKKIKQEDKYTKLDFNAWGDKGYEVYAKGVSKYSGILHLAKHYGIREDNIYAFGDSYNDIHMLTHLKNSVAVGNGVEEVKKIASYVSPPINEGGILTACYELGLLED